MQFIPFCLKKITTRKITKHYTPFELDTNAVLKHFCYEYYYAIKNKRVLESIQMIFTESISSSLFISRFISNGYCLVFTFNAFYYLLSTRHTPSFIVNGIENISLFHLRSIFFDVRIGIVYCCVVNAKSITIIRHIYHNHNHKYVHGIHVMHWRYLKCT